MSTLNNKQLHVPSRSRNAASNKSSSEEKFMPNLKQLREVAEQLPDPEVYVPHTFDCRLILDGAVHPIKFSKQEIQRGSRLVGRWIYEGKVLIRNRDQKQKNS